jgi:hypothetical protein
VQWGGAGIVINSESSVTGADRGHDSGTTTLRPSNGTDRIGLTSTGGGFPGARVREHHGQEDTQRLNWPPCIHRVTNTVRDGESYSVQQGNLEEEQHQQSTLNLEINILGEQQQQHHRTVELEIGEDQDWGETWWEEIVRHPREEEVSARNGCQRTDVEQHSRDERRAGRWRNRPQTAKTRANRKSFWQGAGNLRATLRPMEVQIRAATRKGVGDVDSQVTEKEGFQESAEGVHALCTTEEEMVQELILQWQKGAHGCIPKTEQNNLEN